MRFVKDDSGTAIVEFIVVMLLAVLPIAYLVMAVTRVQAATYAASQAVREAGRAFVQSNNIIQARADARTAAKIAFADQGFELPAGAITFACSARRCLTPSSTVTVQLNWRVSLPLLPASLGSETPASVAIRSDHVVRIDQYRSNS